MLLYASVYVTWTLLKRLHLMFRAGLTIDTTKPDSSLESGLFNLRRTTRSTNS